MPSGVWDASEYDRLVKFDGEVGDQALAGAVNVFMCHQGTGEVCSGWFAHRGDPYELLAVRLALFEGRMSGDVLDYTTDVPLFCSGAEAAAHGKAEIENPSLRADVAITKIVRKRGL